MRLQRDSVSTRDGSQIEASSQLDPGATPIDPRSAHNDSNGIDGRWPRVAADRSNTSAGKTWPRPAVVDRRSWPPVQLFSRSRPSSSILKSDTRLGGQGALLAGRPGEWQQRRSRPHRHGVDEHLAARGMGWRGLLGWSALTSLLCPCCDARCVPTLVARQLSPVRCVRRWEAGGSRAAGATVRRGNGRCLELPRTSAYARRLPMRPVWPAWPSRVRCPVP